MIDTTHRVHTPEGVELSLRVAGPAVRSLAWAIDAVLQLGIVLASGSVLLSLGGVGLGLYLLIAFIVFWFYPVLLEVLWRGRTPGKAAMHIQVVHQDGTPVQWSASVIRNFLRAVDALPFGYLIGLIAMCADPSFRRLGDLAAGTLVIHRDVAPPRGALPDRAPLAPPISLSLEDQSAIIAFTERASRLTRERALELASIPTPLVRSGDPRETLERIGAWLMGRSR